MSREIMASLPVEEFLKIEAKAAWAEKAKEALAFYAEGGALAHDMSEAEDMHVTETGTWQGKKARECLAEWPEEAWNEEVKTMEEALTSKPLRNPENI